MKFKPVQSLQRGLAMLEAVSSRREGMGLRELATAGGCTSAAAFHLAQTLTAAGYLQRLEAPPRYVLGSKLQALTQNHLQDRFYQAVHEAMLAIHRELPDANIHFAQQVGASIIVRTQLMADRSPTLQHDVNMTLPPLISAGSAVHMAWWSQDQREQYLSQYPFDTFGKLFWKSRKQFDKFLAQALCDGGLLLPGQEASRLRLGIPVLNASGVVMGSITVQLMQGSDRGIEGRKKRLLALSGEVTRSIIQQLNG